MYCHLLWFTVYKLQTINRVSDTEVSSEIFIKERRPIRANSILHLWHIQRHDVTITHHTDFTDSRTISLSCSSVLFYYLLCNVNRTNVQKNNNHQKVLFR